MITRTELSHLWSEIKPQSGKNVGRRADPSHPLDFFITYDEKPNMQLMLLSDFQPIKGIYDESKQNYGAPKVTKKLREAGKPFLNGTVGKYMKQMGIKAQWVKPWTFTTKDSDFSSKLKNILDEHFNLERLNAVWYSDITYIWTIDGFVYLTSIMDLYSRKIFV